MPFDQIFQDILVKFAQRVGGEFNQEKKAEEHLKDWEHKNEIQGGYCLGACLHWLQRNLSASAVKQVQGCRNSVISMATAYVDGYAIEDNKQGERSKMPSQFKAEA